MLRRSVCFAPPIGLLALLGACAAPPPPAQPAVTVSSASATSTTGSVDGVYRGSATGSSRCGTSSFGYPLRVANGIASIQTNTAGRIEGPVSPDGTLAVEHGRQFLQGKFSGNSFIGSLTFGNCAYTLDYAKR